MLQNNESGSLDHTTFLKFRKLYLLAILLIAMTIIIAQILIQRHLDSQLDDSRIINIAGRQRMLSQKLMKETLMLQTAGSKTVIEKIVQTLEDDLAVFTKTHEDLQYDIEGIGKMNLNNSEIPSLFKEIDKDQKQLVSSLSKIIEAFDSEQDLTVIDISSYVHEMIVVEGQFLSKMDTIVNEYDAISQEKVKALKQKEYILLVISLVILLLEILFLFRPISLYIRNVIKRTRTIFF